MSAMFNLNTRNFGFKAVLREIRSKTLKRAKNALFGAQPIISHQEFNYICAKHDIHPDDARLQETLATGDWYITSKGYVNLQAINVE